MLALFDRLPRLFDAACGANGRAGNAPPPAPHDPPELLEVVTPRTNAATITPAENLLAAVSAPLAVPAPFALEIAATHDARWFLVRAGSPGVRCHLEDQLAAAYPQAALRPLDAGTIPGLDPARRLPGERVATCALTLRAPEYLPLRTFRDADLAADRAAHAAQADPVVNILSAMGSVPPGWRAVSQLALSPAPDDWCRGYQRLALEHPLAAERAATTAGNPSLLPVLLLAAALGAAALGWQAWNFYLDDEWLSLVLLLLGVGAGIPAAAWAAWRHRHLFSKRLHDPRLVEEKIGRIAYRCQLRLAVFAPDDAPEAEVEERLRHVAAAYRQFSLATGNGLVARGFHMETWRPDDAGGSPGTGATEGLEGNTGRALCTPEPLPAGGRGFVLNVRELAGLWHLPQAQADVPLLERTTARRWLPLPGDVARGCPIGVSAHQSRRVPVCLPDGHGGVLDRHMLLVAKTRRGKSSLLLHLARHVMAADGDLRPGGTATGAGRDALVLVDPHRDLARAALGLVPPERRDGVVFLDVGAADAGERAFGLNLIDVGLGWSSDRAVANTLLIFQREFGRNWGPRMEDAFRWTLKTLFAANQLTCRVDPAHGPDRQFTVLQVPTLLSDPGFQEGVLKMVADPEIHWWWNSYYRPLTRVQRLEIINPVQTKVQKFAGTAAGRAIVGQPRSTIDPAAWLRDGAVVIVDIAKGVVGPDTAAMIGGTLLNLVKEVIAAQAALAPAARRRVTLVVDEFQSVPGADYESMLSELAKYGASLIMATQSLEHLSALDRMHQRALRATVFANIDALFAFHCSAEDARYLVRELGGVTEDDLRELGEHRTYAKLSARGERLPLFLVDLAPPPANDPTLGAELEARSAARYGRDLPTIQQYAARLAEVINELRRRSLDERPPTASGDGGDQGKDGMRGGPDAVKGTAPARADQGTEADGRHRATSSGDQGGMGTPRAAGAADGTLKRPNAPRPAKRPARSEHRNQKDRLDQPDARPGDQPPKVDERQLALPLPGAQAAVAEPSAAPDTGGDAVEQRRATDAVPDAPSEAGTLEVTD